MKPAARSKRALERAIESDKEQLQSALSTLGACVKDEVDPRVKVVRRPYVSIGVAFAVGFAIAVVLPAKNR